MNTPVVSVEATIHSDFPGLNTLLVGYFTGVQLFAKIQRSDAGITQATVQGHPKLFPSSLEYLRVLLQLKYGGADITWGDVCAVAEEDRFNSVTVEEESLKSPGDFQEKELDEISFGGSAATEAMKKIIKEAVISMANEWIPAIKKKHISVKYNGETFDLQVTSIQSLPALIEAVQKKFPLALGVKKLYRLDEGTPIVVTDVSDLRDGFLYHVLAGSEELPGKRTTKFTASMEEFFQRLKTEQDMSDSQVEKAKECFAAQHIKIKQLMATGELALTDEKLKKYGITQGGLRFAILAIIRDT